MKIIGIFVCMLLITTALPIINASVIKNVNFNDIQNYEFVPGEFFVKFTKDIEISSHSIKTLNEKHQVSSIEKVFKNSENTILDNIYILNVPEDSDILSVVNDYSSNPYVEYAEPNYLISLFSIPNDEKFSNQWFHHNTGQSNGNPDADIDAPEAWDIETGSADITIAIIDTGIDYTHPDLVNNIWLNTDETPDNGIDDDENGYIDDTIGWDFVGESVDNPQPDNDPLDDFGHGTHCAGIASAVANNNIGVAGVCWNCKIMPIRVGGGAMGLLDLNAVVEGIAYAVDNEAHVISMSLGGYNFSETLGYAVNYAYENDVVAVAGAGNLPVSIKAYPAAYDSVIAVAATNNHDDKAWFSAYGDWIDVAAPGLRIYSTMPTYFVPLNLVYSMDYSYMEGTSMSCPIVAGQAALLLSYDPNLTPDEVRSIIHDSTDWIDTDKYIGNGRINANKALLIASGVTVPPNKPGIPSGATNGNTGTEYTYTTTINTDPDGDDLYYLFSWGDSTYSGWVGPFASGAAGSATHKWTQNGAYVIKVKARDEWGVESEWSDPLSVSMPRNKATCNSLLQRFLEQFPILQKLLLLIK